MLEYEPARRRRSQAGKSKNKNLIPYRVDYVKGQSANDFSFRMGLVLHQFLAR
jgi:hypothetical protein